MEKAYDLFMLLFNLSQLHSKERVISIFTKKMNEIFHPVVFNFSAKQLQSSNEVFEIKTIEVVYGYLEAQMSSDLRKESRNLMVNAIQMLAMILENLDLNQNLTSERDSFERVANQRMEELSRTVKNLERARTASINLIEDLSDEIEKRVATEKSLRDSEDKYRRIAENINDVVWTTDLNLNTTYVSPSLFGFSGETPEEQANRPVTKRYTPQSLQLINSTLSEELKKEKDPTIPKNRSRILEVQHIRPDGKLLWASMNVTFIRDAFGNPIGLQGVTRDITEQKIAREALKNSEEQLRLAIDAGKIGLFDFNIQTGLASVNDEYAQMLGYDPGELRETSSEWSNRLHPEDRFSVEKTLRDYIDGKIPEYITEARQKHQNGDWVWILSQGKIVEYSPKGIPTRMLGTHINITQRKQYERLTAARIKLLGLAEKESLSFLLLETLAIAEDLTGSQIGFYHFVDEQRGTIELNQWSERTVKEFCIINQNQYMHYPISKAGAWVECFTTRKPVFHNDFESLTSRKGMPEGHVKLVRELVVPVLRNNKIVSVLGIGNKPSDYTKNDADIISQLADLIWDIAEKKIAQERLRKSEEKYRLIFEKSPLGVIHFDKDGKISECNENFVEIIGSSKAVLVGLEMRKLPDRKIVQIVNQVLKGISSTYEGIYKSVTAQKVTPVRMLFAPIIGSDGNVEGGIGLIEDRSSHVQKEEFKKQVEVVQESVKFKQNFLANMSHEIRTPLTGVLGMIEILEQTHLSEKQQEYLNILKNSGENLKEIINQVLDFSKIEAGKVNLNYTHIEFKSIADDAYKLFMSICRKDVELAMELDEKIPVFIKADKNRISQVVNNLISNAVKFTHKGKITLRAGIVSRDIKTGKVVIKIEVEDSGIGIPDDMQKKLFIPFSQIDENDTRVYEGTGLGLSICKELVNLHGGDIGVISKHLKGSIFWFTFSAETSGPEQLLSASAAQIPSSKTRNLQILFAEDKVVNQKVVTLLLKSLGHDVTIAKDGKQALEFYEAGKFDLILMDIQMPVMDGITATRKLKSLYKNLPPIVGLSANAFEGDREKYMAMGMDGYLTKPVKREDFNEIINQLFS